MGRDTTTPDRSELVSENESECRGLLAPFLDRAEVIVGSAAGAAGVPQGFAAGGLGGGVSTGLVVAGVVAGQTVSVSPSEVIFAVSGRPGERIVFSFQLAPAP